MTRLKKSEIRDNRLQTPSLVTSASNASKLDKAGGTLTGTLVMQNHILFNSAKIIAGTGDPEGSITANVGSLYLREDTGTNIAYIKTTGVGNTGWTPLV